MVRGLLSGKEVCDMKLNYMFVKIHKAGSTTTACILQRFGYENNLTFVLPMNGGAYVGWPNLFKQEDVIPSEDSFFNVFVNHAIYHKELLENIMAPNTVYLTTLRHPLAHLRSVFNWYHLTKHFKGLEGKDPVESFLKNPTKFEIPYVIHHNKPYSHTKNFMAYNLGFPLGLSDNQSVVADFINRMSRDMHLVLILEHFNESLVLLKRMMCWDVKDILYDLVPKQIKTYNKSSENITRLVVMHRHWSNVDYQLYDHFNATLWNRIENEGDDFSREKKASTDSAMTEEASQLDNWADRNDMLLNGKKSQMLLICFSRNAPVLPPLSLGGELVPVTTVSKGLGFIFDNKLSWREHVKSMVSKASSRLHYLRLLTKQGMSVQDLVQVYLSLIRPVLEYGHVLLVGCSEEQAASMERVQRRALRIISRGGRRSVPTLPSLKERREAAAVSLFKAMLNPEHPLHDLVPAQRQSVTGRSLRNSHNITVPHARTKRLQQSFLHYTIRLYNNLP
ncbi:PREDICTED: galactosylceramide sulfotransferase-like [Branchiostoma belcheri]|uniref:Galactosylceramide sulfotransferase-like n=1 Tax=Branchiostoma belcheri TaxID=7741 RepID=A0A6P4YBW8_BRABE|nr:PREDICTED: galactosylceramide sulfotransferase-like [Branchiostoma belcheri]